MPLTAVIATALALILLGTFGSSAAPRASADVQGAPHLEIDADPTNGTGPCHPIDATRTVAASGAYDVAVCIDESAGPPDSFEATINWGGPVSASDVPDAGDALDDNPDFNQAPGPTGNGTNWSCTGFGFGFPTVGANGGPPAHIVCNEKSLVAGPMTDNPGLLATFHVSATGSGTATFSLSTDGTSSVNSPAGSNNGCGVNVSCPGANVTQGTGGATATPTNTPAPPTATPTVCSGNCPTATQVTFITVTSTPSSTPTATTGGGETPPPGGGEGTPPPGGGSGAGGGTPPPGGGGQGSITPPNTGTGGASGSRSPWLWIGLGVAGAAAFGAGTVIRHRAGR